MPGIPIVPVEIVLVGIGLLVGLLCIPLLLGKVPPNRWYGVRVPAAFASRENWYTINAFGARRLLLFAVVTTSLGLACQWLPGLPFWVPIACLVASLVLLLVTVFSISRYAASFPRKPI